ncbi:MAG: transporter substrate-binding domain-containing protein [Christensenellales bacterium]
MLSGNIDVIIAGMSPTAERKMTIDFTDSHDTELTVVVRKTAFASAKPGRSGGREDHRTDERSTTT